MSTLSFSKLGNLRLSHYISKIFVTICSRSPPIFLSLSSPPRPTILFYLRSSLIQAFVEGKIVTPPLSPLATPYLSWCCFLTYISNVNNRLNDDIIPYLSFYGFDILATTSVLHLYCSPHPSLTTTSTSFLLLPSLFYHHQPLAIRFVSFSICTNDH